MFSMAPRACSSRTAGQTGRHRSCTVRAAATAASALLAATAGCIATPFGKSCTEIGCGDGLSVSIAVEGDGVSSGITTINVMVEGAASSCQVSVDQLNQPVDCGSQLSVTLLHTFTCESRTSSSGDESESCQPDGGFELQLSSFGTPAEVSFELVDDAGTATRFDLQPTYEKFFPNGKECDPSCDQAQVELGPVHMGLSQDADPT